MIEAIVSQAGGGKTYNVCYRALEKNDRVLIITNEIPEDNYIKRIEVINNITLKLDKHNIRVEKIKTNKK